MFIQPVSSPPPGMSAITTATASPASPSRPSRLRGLSYLRNYTQNHLLSRENHHHNHSAVTSAANTATNSGSSTPSARPQPASADLTRSASYSPTPSGAPNNRLTLISSTPDPASAAATSQSSLEPADESLEITAATQVSASTTTTTTTTTDHASSTSVPASFDGDSTPAEATMGRNRHSMPGDATTTAAGTGTATPTGTAAPTAINGPEAPPSIRFSAYYDPRSTRPSLTFPPITRTLPTGSEKIRVGRYSERDSQSMSNMPGNQPSSAPVGFKSKVVSRRHCEFWYEDGKWYIKDVKSSSGTFLNHIRLSPPSQESKAFPVNDGDIVQLGIDFKGGEEMIFRCVKMRLELNRGWQTKLNTFNMAAHKRLQTMAAAGASSTSSQECTICLGSIAPCQSLFVAPCSHTWHFKCVRSLLTSPQYPIFICPNCRAGADLEADVDEIEEEWRQLNAEKQSLEEANGEEKPAPDEQKSQDAGPAPVEAVMSNDNTSHGRLAVDDTEAMDVTVNVSHIESSLGGDLNHAVSDPLPIQHPASGAGRPLAIRSSRSPSPQTGNEGPITPRNDAGPWVFDGSANREGDAAQDREMTSLDAAADMDMSDAPGSDVSSSSSLRVEHHS